MKYINQEINKISYAVDCLLDNNGGAEISQFPNIFKDEASKEGLLEAIEAGIIIYEHGRFYLHPQVCINLIIGKIGVAF